MVTTNPTVRSNELDTNTKLRSQVGDSNNLVADRIKERLHALGPGRDVPWLSRAAGIPASTLYDNLKRGIGKPEHAVAIARALDVSIDWLLTGSGSERSAGPSTTNFDRPPASSTTRDLVQVPEIDPSFGLGAVFMDEAAAPEMRTFSRGWLRQITTTPPDELYWAAGRGNSMAPTIEDGEPVLIDRRQQSPRDADLIWAFAWGDIGAIKRLRPMPDGSVKILSDNPAVPPESAHGSEIHIFGRVVAVVKNL
jgi:phage repressor protein C with HTH and peptisase S24 domain